MHNTYIATCYNGIHLNICIYEKGEKEKPRREPLMYEKYYLRGFYHKNLSTLII